LFDSFEHTVQLYSFVSCHNEKYSLFQDGDGDNCRFDLPNRRRVMNEVLSKMSRDRKKAHKRLLDLGSPTYAAFLDMERAAYADGELPKMAKELIAVGISVVIDCHSCMQWHIEQAAAAGASLRQMLEAVDVGIEMGGGPATVSARFALDVMADVYGEEAFQAAKGQGQAGK
jgi:AhpD family alkylhydroperoxidase